MLTKNIYTLVLLFTLAILPTNMFAKGTGYVWIASNGFTEAINHAREDMKFVFNAIDTLPDINSIVALKEGNKVYKSFNVIQKIHQKYLSLLASGKCKTMKASSSAFMLNLNKKSACSVDKVLGAVIKETQPHYDFLKGKDTYFRIKNKKVKVLGHIQFEYLSFMFIQW